MSDTPVSVDTTPYLQKLVKLIPGEVVVLYSTVLGLIAGLASGAGLTAAQFVVAGICLLLTPFYLVSTKVKNVGQIVVSTVSFALYAFVSGGPFTTLGWYQAWMPATFLVLFTLIVPMFVKTQEAAVGTAAGESKPKSWREV